MKYLFHIRIVVTAILFLYIPNVVFSQASCATATSLTPGSTCSATQGNLRNAVAATPAPVCGSGSAYSVWYRFTATATSTNITIDNFGNNLTGVYTPYLQLFSGTCAGLTSISCIQASGGTASIAATGLTISTTYYLRVYTTTQGTSNPTNSWNFDICVQTPPANDECSGAVTLTSGTSCSNTSGSLHVSTTTTGLPAGCETGGTHYDVWYRFVAGSTYEIITVSSMGSNITNPEIQLYSGSCGSLTSLQCGTSSISATGLTIGSTYYVRFSNIGTAISSNGTFNICVYHPATANKDYGKSYVNITRNSGGGTVNPGDTLEIRATLVIRSQSLDSLSFIDTLNNAGGLRLVPGSLALRTNEGKIYKSFTDAFDSDAGYYYTSGTDTVIRINMGTGATATARGKLFNTSKPSVFGGTCIIMATYRVVVYADYNTNVNVGGGYFTTRDVPTGISFTLSFASRNAIVYSSPGLCPNAVSATNAIGGDTNGTFGAPSGSAPLAKNRAASSNVPGYIYANFSTGAPQDYYYGITNNTSGSGSSFSIVSTWAKPDNSSPTHRVFNVWDIIGDHTGATNTARGNPPCDTTKVVSTTNPCGYMLVINSAYKTDTAFQYSVTNLCPNTYYEISAWVRNICSKCSCDSNGVGVSGAGYIPFAPGDSSGVQPNLAFDINGTDYFTTGNIVHTGNTANNQRGSDSTNIWVKRGFVYLTGPSQTSLTLSIRNNAPGGGGNDWALDDITLATCLPNMKYSPSLSPTVCDSNAITIYDTIQSYFNNYTYYKWQRSTDGGANWTDVTAALGPVTPVWNGSAWEYITSYTIPPGYTNLSNNGDMYRVVVATTLTNLSNNNCQVTDGVSIITLNVIDCGPEPMSVNILSFYGRVNNDHANLYWSASEETEAVMYDIEKSNDGLGFYHIGSINGLANGTVNHYSFTDPVILTGKAWYRIIMTDSHGMKKYSRVIQFKSSQIEFGLSNVISPFGDKILFDITTLVDSKFEVTLIDMVGQVVRRKTYMAYSGINSFELENTGALRPGIYIFQVRSKDLFVNRKLLKK